MGECWRGALRAASPLPYVAAAHERALKRPLRNGLETFLHNTVMSPAMACAPSGERK